MVLSQLVVSDVYKAYGNVAAVDGIRLDVTEGDCLALLGPSGCGKTTLLRLIAGLLEPDRGTIHFAGREITHVPVYKRSFGFVFQNYALFPHMTVEENVGYGLRVRGIAKVKRKQEVWAALERVGLPGVEKRFPNQLSGGQQQRVALARALVIRPNLLLLDEPLGALDKNLREEMQVELRQLQKSVGITTIFVTHDQEEAMTLSDQIAVLRDGKILQVGSPQQVYDYPADQFVASFLGTTNFLNGIVAGHEENELIVTIGETSVRVEANQMSPAAGTPIQIAVRPEKLHISADSASGGIHGTVITTLFQGHRIITLFRADDGTELQIFVRPGSATVTAGDEAYVWWESRAAAAFVAKGEQTHG